MLAMPLPAEPPLSGNAMPETLKFSISGKVQGVCFRDCTRDKAVELGLSGWVRNLPNGRVEAVARGESEQLDKLKEWLWTGPPLADVTGVSSEPCQEHVPDGFLAIYRQVT